MVRAVTPKTRALLPVHLYGHPADMDPILELGRTRGLAIVEDACQAVGASYKGRPVGVLSGTGALSFYPTKNLGALGDGGAILVEDPAVATRLRRLRNGGQSDRYRHELLGINSRLDEIQAAILRVGLRHLETWTKRRRALAALYLQGLAGLGLTLPVEEPYAHAVQHLFVVRHPRRDALAAGLEARGVGTLIHYPLPLHLQPAFAGCGGRAGDFPVAEAAAREILSLPLYPGLTDAQAESVVAATRATLREMA
jgi:dTDP-3-amino-3,4,6-trideoxy-alpha-D-glucose transaminase